MSFNKMMAHVLEHRDIESHRSETRCPTAEVVNYSLFMAKTAENLTLWGCMYLYMPYKTVTPGTLS